MWLTERLQGTANGNVSDLFQLFSAAGRRMGSAPVGQAPAEVARTALITDAWTQEDLARVSGALAWWSAALPEDRRATLEDLYYRGSGLEKRAVLLALPALDEPEGCLDLAVEACRTNSLEVFCAIACDNAYPGLHFPELPMNQMVLKALFLGLNVDRVMGLEPRITPQLLTDVRQFKAEREAAGRAVPSGVDWIMNKASRK
jgi:hypothetical protein